MISRAIAADPTAVSGLLLFLQVPEMQDGQEPLAFYTISSLPKCSPDADLLKAMGCAPISFALCPEKQQPLGSASSTAAQRFDLVRG